MNLNKFIENTQKKELLYKIVIIELFNNSFNLLINFNKEKDILNKK